MHTSGIIWQNGKFVPGQNAVVHVLTHSLHYGSAAFEGIRFYDTPSEKRVIFRLPEHIQRFYYSAQALGMKIPFSKKEIKDAIKKLVIKNNYTSGYIRPLVYYGATKIGVHPHGNPVEVAIACLPWGAYLPNGVRVKTSTFHRMEPRSTDINAKLTGNYINCVLAALELRGKYDEALLLDTNDYISEGVGENVFFVKNNTILTPKLGTILPGITRDTIIRLCFDLKINVKEKNIKLNEAYNADEAFFTGTAAEVSWIKSIDNHQISDGKIGKITKLLKENFNDIVHGINNKYRKYLTFVD